MSNGKHSGLLILWLFTTLKHLPDFIHPAEPLVLFRIHLVGIEGLGVVEQQQNHYDSEQVEEVLKAMGAEYSPSTVSIKDMNKKCDQKFDDINKCTDSDDDGNPILFYIALAF